MIDLSLHVADDFGYVGLCSLFGQWALRSAVGAPNPSIITSISDCCVLDIRRYVLEKKPARKPLRLLGLDGLIVYIH